MSTTILPSRPRITSATANKYIGRNVTVIGEVQLITPHANTITLRLPDDETIIILLQKNSTTIEPNLLTEVSGKLVSRGQIESTFIKQFSQKETTTFNRKLYNDAAFIFEAQRSHYDI